MKIPNKLLFFVVGRSGSGKDTLMQKSAKILKLENIKVTVLLRVITRAPDENEKSLFVSESEFLQRKDNNEFVLSWFIYGNWYGCPRQSLETSLQRGEIVLVNVSRGILYEAKKKFPQSKIILIQVPINIAQKRVELRGREKGNHLNARLTRITEKVDMPSPNKIIINDGDLTKAAHELSSYLRICYLDSKSI
ncbi:MAG: phosphonate metabolism protein/1,5-bisphosphokinase (PRPP-forming) PhnN [Candidatus Hermodarchaeota archaeon]